MTDGGKEPDGRRGQTIDWRRFALLGSGVITGAAVIRLIADAVGIPRGTAASAVVASVSNFLMYITLGLGAPYVVRGMPKRPVGRRLVILAPIALIAAVINFWYLRASL